MSYVKHIFVALFLLFFVASSVCAQFTTPTTDDVAASAEYQPTKAQNLRVFRWEINGASDSATGYNSSTADSNYPNGKPIDVSTYSTASMQIAEVTGIGGLMSLSTTPLVQGAIGSATRNYWIEGKIDTSASGVVNYVTLPMREVSGTTIGSATNGERWWREGVSQFGIFEVDLRGIQTIRIKCGGGAIPNASAAIWVGLWQKE